MERKIFAFAFASEVKYIFEFFSSAQQQKQPAKTALNVRSSAAAYEILKLIQSKLFRQMFRRCHRQNSFFSFQNRWFVCVHVSMRHARHVAVECRYFTTIQSCDDNRQMEFQRFIIFFIAWNYYYQ